MPLSREPSRDYMIDLMQKYQLHLEKTVDICKTIKVGFKVLEKGESTLKYSIRIIKRLFPFIQKNHIILLAFFLPLVILEIAYITCGIFPFGKKSLLIIDLYHQYAPFISDLQDKLRSFSSLLYSWSGGLGTNYLPLFAYYLASPLNLITVLFPKDHLAEAVLVLTLLKVGMSGACFAFYLKGVHREQSLITVAFSLLYALSGYVLVFSWDIMWLDAIYLLPLIMLGIVKLIRDARGLFFCITLAIALLSNFYMAFSICIFALLYYPVCLFHYHSIKKPVLLIKKTAQFAGYSLLSAGLSAILLLPTWFALRLSSAADDIFPRTITQYFDLFDFLTRHFTAASPSIREGMPNQYSGIVVLILIPVYFLCKSIRMKDKLWHLSLLLILILSFNTNVLNFIWHGFHFPNQVPYRFSFVYIFLILSMCYEAFNKLHEFTGKQIGAICISILSLIILSQKFDDLSLDYLTLYISILFIILYAAALTIDRSCSIRFSYRILFLVLVITAEVTTNTILTIQKIDSIEGYTSRDGYSNGKEVMQIRSRISAIAAEDKGFYRMQVLPSKTANDPFLYNYRGLSVFSSASPLKPVRMLQNLGFSSNNINSYEYEGSTAILDSLFGIKYLIYRSININESLYKPTPATGKLTVFKNPYALPLGFQSTNALEKYSSYSSNPFNSQNNLIDSICGIKDVLVPIDQKQGTQFNLTFSSSGSTYYSFKRTNKDMDSTARVQFTVKKDQQVYLYFKAPSSMKGSGFVTVNDKKVEFNSKHSTVINLGFCKSGTLPELQINFDKSSPESGSFEIYACGLDLPVFENAMSLIREKSLTVQSFTDTSIHGHVEAADADLMVMTIPYNKGWHVMVDNKEVETQAIDNCLLSFKLTEGTHTIDLRFVPDKFYIGIVITLVSILILFLLLIKSGAMVLPMRKVKRE